MKTISLPYAIKRSLRANDLHKSSLDYASAEDILILFTADGSDEQFQQVEKAMDQFQQDEKQVSFLYLLLKDENQPSVGLDEHMNKLHKRDIGFMGDLKDERVSKLLNKEFDFCVHADLYPNIYADLILAKVKSRCKIGHHDEARGKFYDFMIRTEHDNDLSLFLNQVYHYAKLL